MLFRGKREKRMRVAIHAGNSPAAMKPTDMPVATEGGGALERSNLFFFFWETQSVSQEYEDKHIVVRSCVRSYYITWQGPLHAGLRRVRSCGLLYACPQLRTTICFVLYYMSMLVLYYYMLVVYYMSLLYACPLLYESTICLSSTI
jgi:hypothetical protein